MEHCKLEGYTPRVLRLCNGSHTLPTEVLKSRSSCSAIVSLLIEGNECGRDKTWKSGESRKGERNSRRS